MILLISNALTKVLNGKKRRHPTVKIPDLKNMNVLADTTIAKSFLRGIIIISLPYSIRPKKIRGIHSTNVLAVVTNTKIIMLML